MTSRIDMVADGDSQGSKYAIFHVKYKLSHLWFEITAEFSWNHNKRNAYTKTKA